MSTQRSVCIFCDGLIPGDSHAPWDSVLAETPEFVITPSKGALVPGWLLITSKRHALCAGALEAQDFRGLRAAFLVATDLLQRHFGPVTLFEHGPLFHGTPLGCGIDHLHVHAVPLGFSLKAAFNEMFPLTRWQDAPHWDALAHVHQSGIGYVAVQEVGCGLAWAVAPENVRQPWRRVIARKLGVTERFDYRQYPEIGNVLRTIAAFPRP
jgi:hypothetical protein